MEAGFMVIAFVAVAISFALGYLLGHAGRGKGVQGTVHVVRSIDNTDTYLYLESNVTIEELASKPQAIFNVKNTRQNSHE